MMGRNTSQKLQVEVSLGTSGDEMEYKHGEHAELQVVYAVAQLNEGQRDE